MFFFNFSGQTPSILVTEFRKARTSKSKHSGTIYQCGNFDVERDSAPELYERNHPLRTSDMYCAVKLIGKVCEQLRIKKGLFNYITAFKEIHYWQRPYHAQVKKEIIQHSSKRPTASQHGNIGRIPEVVENNMTSVKNNQKKKESKQHKPEKAPQIPRNPKKAPTKEEKTYRRNVEPDGNCLFRCISVALYGQENKHGQIRRIVTDHMKEHKEQYEPFIEEPFAKYIRNMQKTKGGKEIWASETELMALAKCFNLKIEVIKIGESTTMNTTYGADADNKLIKLVLENEHYNIIV